MNQPSYGRLLGVSLGPGDPGLITRNAWATLQSEARWAYPIRREGAESYALEIARRGGLEPPPDALPLVFPMTHDQQKLAGYWLRAAEAVLPVLRAGRDLAFLVEGDASTYATFGHLARTVSTLDPQVPVEVIAGVSSFNAAAARAATPLAESDDTLALLPAGYGVEQVERLLQDFDTLVLLKVKPLMDELIELFERRGLLPHAWFIERAGTPEERVVHDLLTLRGETVHYLSLILVKNPHRKRTGVKRGCRSRKATGEPRA